MIEARIGEFQYRAPYIGFEWPLSFTRRTAGVTSGFQPQVENGMVWETEYDKLFFRVIMTTGTQRQRIRAG